jgi:hypothetical protein
VHKPHQSLGRPDNEKYMIYIRIGDHKVHVGRTHDRITVDYMQSNTVKKTYQLGGKIWVAWHVCINILLHRSCNLNKKHTKSKHLL